MEGIIFGEIILGDNGIKYVSISNIPNITLSPVLIKNWNINSLNIVPNEKLMVILDNFKKELIEAVYRNKKIFLSKKKNIIEELYCNPCKSTPIGNILTIGTKDPILPGSIVSGDLVISGLWVNSKSWGPCIGIENISTKNISGMEWNGMNNFIDSESDSEIDY